MKRTSIALGWLLSFSSLVLAGCGSSSPPPTTTAPAKRAAPAAPAVAAPAPGAAVAAATPAPAVAAAGAPATRADELEASGNYDDEELATLRRQQAGEAQGRSVGTTPGFPTPLAGGQYAPRRAVAAPVIRPQPAVGARQNSSRQMTPAFQVEAGGGQSPPPPSGAMDAATRAAQLEASGNYDDEELATLKRQAAAERSVARKGTHAAASRPGTPRVAAAPLAQAQSTLRVRPRVRDTADAPAVDTPEEAVTAFLKAVAARDQDGMAQGMSRRAIGRFERIREKTLKPEDVDFITARVGGGEISGSPDAIRPSEQIVTLVVGKAADKPGQQVAVTVTREDGYWKILRF